MPRLKALLLALYLTAFFISYLGPITEGDLFWHLRTGQNVLESNAISAKTQWLGQSLLYLIWKVSGYAGIVFLRASVYTSILGFLFVWMRKEGVGFYTALLFLLFPAQLFLSFPNERPQIFSFLLFPIVVYLLEGYRKSTHEGAVMGWHWMLLLLIPVWANIHAGYLLGLSSIWIYLIAAIIGYARKRTPFGKLAVMLVIACSPAMLLALFNLKSFALLPGAIQSVLTPVPYMKGVVEYLSPFTALRRMGQFYPPYWIFLAFALFVLVRNVKKMPVEHTLMLVLFALLSLRFLRFMPFLLMLSPFVSVRMKGEEEWEKSKTVFAGFTGVLVLWLIITPINIKPSISEDFPVRGTEFLYETHPKGKIFNYQGWAGFVLWRMPEANIFIPVEGVSDEVDDAYSKIIWAEEKPSYGKPQWQAYMDAYGVDVVFMPGISPVSGEIYPIIDALVKDDRWKLVYSDDVSNVFIKDAPLNAVFIGFHSMPKDNVYRQIRAQAHRYLKKDPKRPALLRSVETANRRLGVTESPER